MDLYTGQYGDEVFKIGAYHPDESNGKIVHLLSCQTGRELGRDFVTNGCRAYFGYDENFTFIMSYADRFFECDSEIDLALADGLNAGEAYERVVELFDRRIQDLRDSGHDYVAAVLEFDRDHLRCPTSGGSAWGSEAAKLS